MDKVVIIGASELQYPLIMRAKERGFETHVFDIREGLVGGEAADVFYQISIDEKEKILEICREIKPVAVVSIASELANITVNYVARGLGLVSNSERCVRVSTNKYEMRKALSAADIRVPAFCAVGEGDELSSALKMSFPLIVKPTDRSGSRCVSLVYTPDALEYAVKMAISSSFEKKAMVEEYIEGEEYSLEAVTYYGEHSLVAITKKFTTGAPSFIEKGHVQPSGLSPKETERVRDAIFEALDALEIRFGASHSEFKLCPDGEIRIIEIGSRMGGDYIGSELTPLSTGYDMVGAVLDVALGKLPSNDIKEHYGAAAIRYIFSHEDEEYYSRLKAEHPECIYRASEITVTDVPVTDSASRYGYYIVVGDAMERLVW